MINLRVSWREKSISETKTVFPSGRMTANETDSFLIWGWWAVHRRVHPCFVRSLTRYVRIRVPLTSLRTLNALSDGQRRFGRDNSARETDHERAILITGLLIVRTNWSERDSVSNGAARRACRRNKSFSTSSPVRRISDRLITVPRRRLPFNYTVRYFKDLPRREWSVRKGDET